MQTPASSRVMGFHNLLLVSSRRHRSPAVLPREDASPRSLQPTCCHEHPPKHPTPKLQALAFPTAATGPALPLEPSPEFPHVTVHDDVEYPLPASSTLGGDAVGAAPPAAASITAPKGGPVSQALARADFVGPTRARYASSRAPPVTPSLLPRHPELGSWVPRPASVSSTKTAHDPQA